MSCLALTVALVALDLKCSSEVNLRAPCGSVDRLPWAPALVNYNETLWASNNGIVYRSMLQNEPPFVLTFSPLFQL
jgi:hypothetical protein